MAFPESVRRVIDELAKLPGVGPRTAERLALHLVRCPAREARSLAEAIATMVDRVGHCGVCFNLSETDPCPICADPSRDRSRVLVVERPRDVQVLERTGYRGLYHVLQGRVTPRKNATGAEQSLVERTLSALVKRVGCVEVREIILGTNPDLEGDGTALAVHERLRHMFGPESPHGSQAAAPADGQSPRSVRGKGRHPVRLTRLARGVPTGASLEHVNPAVLAEALSGRTVIASSIKMRPGDGLEAQRVPETQARPGERNAARRTEPAGTNSKDTETDGIAPGGTERTDGQPTDQRRPDVRRARTGESGAVDRG